MTPQTINLWLVENLCRIFCQGLGVEVVRLPLLCPLTASARSDLKQQLTKHTFHTAEYIVVHNEVKQIVLAQLSSRHTRHIQ